MMKKHMTFACLAALALSMQAQEGESRRICLLA